MKSHPHLQLVHSQPAENCITVVEFRPIFWPLVAVSVVIAIQVACFYAMWRMFK